MRRHAAMVLHLKKQAQTHEQKFWCLKQEWHWAGRRAKRLNAHFIKANNNFILRAAKKSGWVDWSLRPNLPPQLFMP